MSSSKSSETPVCFGYETALELLDAASRANIPRSKSRRRQAPHRTASPQLIESAAQTCAPLFEGLFAPTMPLQVLASTADGRQRTRMVRSHLMTAPIHGSGFVTFSPDGALLAADGALLFVQMAQTLSFVDLLELGFELCGTYRRPRNGQQTQYNVEPIASPRIIERFVDANLHLNGSSKAKAALAYLAPLSASPRETKAALLLGLPTHYGGYGLGIPRLNHPINCTDAARVISGSRTLRCDLYWPEGHLDIEYQSRTHHAGELHRVHDARRAHALKSMGINVAFLTGEDLDSMQAMDVIAASAKKALGQRNRIRTNRFHEKKLRLRRQLGLPIESHRTYPISNSPK